MSERWVWVTTLCEKGCQKGGCESLHCVKRDVREVGVSHYIVWKGISEKWVWITTLCEKGCQKGGCESLFTKENKKDKKRGQSSNLYNFQKSWWLSGQEHGDHFAPTPGPLHVGCENYRFRVSSYSEKEPKTPRARNFAMEMRVQQWPSTSCCFAHNWEA